jgi:hypothetical protein
MQFRRVFDTLVELRVAFSVAPQQQWRPGSSQFCPWRFSKFSPCCTQFWSPSPQSHRTSESSNLSGRGGFVPVASACRIRFSASKLAVICTSASFRFLVLFPSFMANLAQLLAFHSTWLRSALGLDGLERPHEFQKKAIGPLGFVSRA